MPHPHEAVRQVGGGLPGKYLSKEVRRGVSRGNGCGRRLAMPRGRGSKTLWSGVGDEYRRLRRGDVGLTREQSYGILQDSLRNFPRWVDNARGIKIWMARFTSGNGGCRIAGGVGQRDLVGSTACTKRNWLRLPTIWGLFGLTTKVLQISSSCSGAEVTRPH